MRFPETLLVVWNICLEMIRMYLQSYALHLLKFCFLNEFLTVYNFKISMERVSLYLFLHLTET